MYKESSAILALLTLLSIGVLQFSSQIIVSMSFLFMSNAATLTHIQPINDCCLRRGKYRQYVSLMMSSRVHALPQEKSFALYLRIHCCIA